MAEKYVSVSELRKLLGIPSDGQCTGCQFCTLHGCKDDSIQRACEAIDDAPEADVVDVVRCKDCKHWTGINCGYCEVWEHYISNQDYFCGSGERRANNG